MKEQHLLLSIESVFDIHHLKNCRILSGHRSTDHLDPAYGTGGEPFSHQSLSQGIIFKKLSELPSLTDLAVVLKNNPSAAIRGGFNILRPLPKFRETLILKESLTPGIND